MLEKTDSNKPLIPKLMAVPPSISIGALVLVVSFFASDLSTWSWMYFLWMTSPDNSHGLLVPAFSAWLLWQRRGMISFPGPAVPLSAMAVGVGLLLGGVVFRFAGIYMRTITFEALSILPCCAGIVLILFGWIGARWAWPAVMFLVFMIPLPGSFGGALSSALQSIATISSTFLLQLIGVPAVSEGNIIFLTEKPLGVAQACSGLRMMTSFFALSTGVALVIDRPFWEKLLIIFSAPVIAIVSNVLRITATAIAYEFGNEKMAELFFLLFR